MAKAEIKETVAVPIDKMFSAIMGFEHYPKFVDGVKGVKLLQNEAGRVRIEYSLSIMGKDFVYILDHFADQSRGEIRWELVSSDFFKKNSGSWRLVAAGDSKTEATYALDVEFKIMVPGFILNRLVKGSLPTLVRNFEKRALELSNV